MDPQPSRLDVEVQGRTVTLVGVLDSHTADELDASIGRLDEDGDIELHCRELSFVDSSGLRAVLAVNGRLTASGHELRLMALQEPVRRLLAITNLDAHLCIMDDPGADRAGPR